MGGSKGEGSLQREALEAVVVVAAVVVLVLLVAPRALSTSVPLAVVASYSMEPTLHVGDLILVSGVGKPKVGDVIVFAAGGQLIVHRLVRIEESGAGLLYVTRGDYCYPGCLKDQYSPFPAGRAVGRVELVVPYVGIPKLLLEKLVMVLRGSPRPPAPA